MATQSTPTGELAERERAMAKALSMSVLFNRDYYGRIVEILNKKEYMDENDFERDLKLVLADAHLDKDEQEWAFNYLKNYDKELAAASDKKWPVHPDAREFHW